MNDTDGQTIAFSKVQMLLDALDEKFASEEPFSLEDVANEFSLTLGNSAIFEELIAHHFRRLQERQPQINEETYLSHFNTESSFYRVAESACYSSSIFKRTAAADQVTESGDEREKASESGGVAEFSGGPLSSLTVSMQRKLRESMTEETFQDKEKLLSEGDVGECLFVIVSGTVLITSQNPNRDSEILAVLTSGQVIGEMALMGVSHRTADATAKDEVVVLKLLAKDFQALCRKYLEFAQVVTEVIGTRLGTAREDALFSTSLHGYRIHRRLGRGGMSVVYDATNSETEQRVALKMMSHRLAFDDYARSYFQQEAEAVASFDHPNIPKYYELFDAFATSFMAIEFIEGLGLDSLVRRAGAIEESTVLKIGSQLAHALSYAHGAGIVHRDVKPANCMINESGTVKLLDFGLSVPFRKSAKSEGVIVGTPSYMSPEQFSGQPPKPESDWFSLGCVLYELTLGEKLLHPANVLDLGHIFENWNTDFILDSIPSESNRIREIVAVALDLDPEKRSAAFDLLKDFNEPIDAEVLNRIA